MADQQPTDFHAYRHFQTTLYLLEYTNLSPVRVRLNQKEPARPWEPVKNFSEKAGNILELKKGGLNAGVHLFGRYVDVDIDTDNSYMRAGLDTWLPPCAHVWGRSSRRRTHYLYELRDDFDPQYFQVLKHIKSWDETKLEVRGGTASRGEMTVMPGSYHPDGELYEWEDPEKAESTISQTDADTLIRAVRKSAACAVLAPYWIEGCRNDLSMALAGFLYRCYAMLSDSSATDSTFAMFPDEARNFFEQFLEIAGDDPEDKHARLKTFDQTWSKAEQNIPITGANRIGEITGDEEIVRKLYAVLSDSHTFQQLEKFLDRFVVWEGPGLAIDLEWVKKGRQKCSMSPEQFKNSFGNLRVEMNGKPKQLAPMLFTHPSATRVAGFTFRPGQGLMVDEKDGIYINQWAGFGVDPYEEEVSENEVEPFLEYLWDVISDEDEKKYSWVLQWVADIFQHPWRKPGTALALVGKPGAGKSFLGERILRPIIGHSHSAVTGRVDSITKNFNAVFDNKLLVQCDEATNNRQKIIAAQMKSLITDDTIQIEPKNVDAYQKPNMMRFIFTSNDVNDAIAITDGIEDRRYTVLSVSDKHRNDISGFWEPLVEWLTPMNLAKIHKYLLSVEIKESFIMRPIHTKAKEVMATHSGSTFDHWLHEMIARGHPLSLEAHKNPFDAFNNQEDYKRIEIMRENWPEYISGLALLREYELWRKKRGSREADPLNEQQIMQQFKDRGLSIPQVMRPRITFFDEKNNKQVTTRLRIRSMPSRTRIRDYLQSIFGFIELDEDGPLGDEDQGSKTMGTDF